MTAPREKEIRCKNCRFFAEDDSICRRRAPSPRYSVEADKDSKYLLEKTGADEHYNRADWPSVNDFDWCGEFEEAADA